MLESKFGPLATKATRIIEEDGVAKFVRHLPIFLARRLSRPMFLYKLRWMRKEHEKILKKTTQVDGLIGIPIFGYEMMLLAQDPGLSRELLVKGEREVAATEALLKVLQGEVFTVLEIGANQGYNVLLEASALADGSRIYAFEPHPENCRALQRTIEANDLGGVVSLEQMAVSDRPGTSKLVVEAHSNWHHLNTTKSDTATNGNTIEVKTTSIDAYCSDKGIEQVNLIRMDIEGHEYSVLKGAENTIQKSKKCLLFVELHTWILEENGVDVVDFLTELRDFGFNCLHISGHNTPPVADVPWDVLVRDWRILTSRHGYHFLFLKNAG